MRQAGSPVPRTALALLLLVVLLPLPTRPADYELGHFLPPSLDLAVIVIALSLPFASTAPLRAAAAGVLLVLTLLRLADLGMFVTFRRAFNPVLDLHLLASGWELGAATVGPVRAAALIALGVGAVIGLGIVLHWSLAGPARLRLPVRLALCAAIAGLAVVGRGPILPREVADRVERVHTAIADEARFVADLDDDPLGRPDFAALAGRDVIFVFVESYGRAWLDAPASRDRAAARLDAARDRLDAAGFAMRSGWVRAPTRGGQSWLSHAAAMSGLWTSSQARYDALIASERRSLNALFAEAGWRTAAIMPAITRDWPEARWFGYDAVFDRDRLGYRGRAFDWVTMPDQYTLSALDRLARGATPAMIEVALISSHAPWTPLPEILPWPEVGDGSVFDGTRRSGATPQEVWSSNETIRAAWSASLDYAIEVVAQWIARSGDDALIVVLGDHQPAPLVAGAESSAAVPIHVIARDRDLVDHLPGRWTTGLRPASDLPERDMTVLRGLFATCFSTGGCPSEDDPATEAAARRDAVR